MSRFRDICSRSQLLVQLPQAPDTSQGSAGKRRGAWQAYWLLRRSMDLHDELIRLRAMRGLLQTRLLVLEKAIEDQRQHGAAAPDLLKRVEALLASLQHVDAKLAGIRSPVAPA